MALTGGPPSRDLRVKTAITTVDVLWGAGRGRRGRDGRTAWESKERLARKVKGREDDYYYKTSHSSRNKEMGRDLTLGSKGTRKSKKTNLPLSLPCSCAVPKTGRVSEREAETRFRDSRGKVFLGALFPKHATPINSPKKVGHMRTGGHNKTRVCQWCQGTEWVCAKMRRGCEI